MARVPDFLPLARGAVFCLGVIGPVILMGMRGEWFNLPLGAAFAAGVAAGCTIRVAPLILRFVGIIAAVAAIVLQAIMIFQPDSMWDADTAPVLWAMQIALAGGLAYLVWWNERRLLRG